MLARARLLGKFDPYATGVGVLRPLPSGARKPTNVRSHPPAVSATVQVSSTLFLRSFASESANIRRPKAVKVKKSEARRHVEPKQKTALQEHQDALTNVPPPPPPSTNPFQPQEQQPPQTFGGVMKESFLWGIGMALAFSFIGVIFSSMEEAEYPGEYEGSHVVEPLPDTEQT